MAGLLAWGVTPPAAGAPDKPPEPAFIETTGSELVLIEVYVRDRKGNPVSGLAAGDFTLTIDNQGRPSPIQSLEWIEQEHAAPAPAGGTPPTDASATGSAAPAGPDRPAPPATGVVTTRTPWADVPRRFLLFFDDATSSPVQMVNARRSAIALLDRPGQPTDQFGLASYSQKRRLEVLHDFTSDRASLRAELERSIKDNVWRSDFATDMSAQVAAIERKRAEARQAPSGGQAMNMEAEQMARSAASEEMELMRRVLTAMRTLVDGLAPWPGYKAVIYMGDGISDNPATDLALNDPRMALTSDFGGLAMSAGSANVTLHSVQTEGVKAGTAGEVGAASRRSNGLSTLALNTGGVTVTSNDLLGALDTVEHSAEGYYLMTYAPEGPPDGRYHTVSLKMKRGGVTLRFRRGFTRYLPEEARMRAIQAAYVAPELHGDMRLDLAAVRGPAAGSERLFDLVVYLPPGQVLFLPQAGGPVARIEVGIVAIDRNGRETLRLARRVLLTPEAAHAGADRPLAIDFFSRVRLPDRSQTITAVVADVQSGTIGATRLDYDAGAVTATATGVSLYALDERSLWVEVESKSGNPSDEERPVGTTVGPALRTRFAPWERVSCGFRAPSPPPGGAPEMRLAVVRGEEVVRTYPLDDVSPASRADATMHDADLPIDGLADGEYLLRIEEIRAGVPAEIGRARFRIAPPAGG